jgi:hypothetical protein
MYSERKIFLLLKSTLRQLNNSGNKDIVSVHPFTCIIGQTADHIWLLCGIKSLEILSSMYTHTHTHIYIYDFKESEVF